MAHFCNKCGGDEYICQECGTVQCSKEQPSRWLTTKRTKREGNICPRCVKAESGGMTDERIQEIYDNGAELTTNELGEYLQHTVNNNADPLFVFDPDKASKMEEMPDYVINNSAESFDWKLEYKGDGKWYLHPWGA